MAMATKLVNSMRTCILKPIQPEHQTIRLEDGLNIVGRTRETGIRDTRCSRKQIQLNVNLIHCRVQLKVLGSNPCSVNGVMVMQKTECVECVHGDILEIVYGRHPFELVFKPSPEVDITVKPTKEAPVENTTDKEQWDSINNGDVVIYSSADLKSSEKIAGYDIDGTIIKTKSGNVFPKNCDDWQINFSEIPGKLKKLHGNGFKICFFTNQGGIARGKIKLDDFKEKIRQIHKKLGVPIQVFIAIADGYYRKPLPGMWKQLCLDKNDGIALQLDRCFYVGDAAGRLGEGSGVTKRRKDHSLADRLFATNIGISFFTPEEHFLGKGTESWTKPEFEPSNLNDNVSLLEPAETIIPSDVFELIIMVGLPGSGKSHFCQQHLQPLGYTIANADTLRGTQACIKACQRALESSTSCVIDNTNVDIESRKKFLELASRIGVKSRCFVMNVSLGHVKHNIAYRQLTDTTHSKINEMILNSMKKKYTSPTLDEGFIEIAKVNIKPTFDSVESKDLYKLYLVDK